MEIYILDQSTLDRIGTVDIYESLIWNTYFADIGSFELHCSLDYFHLLKEERLVQNTEDNNHTGLIEYIYKTEDQDGVESLVVKGRMAEILLSRRIADGQYAYESLQPAEIAANLITNSYITPTDEARKINLEITSLPVAPAGVISYAGANENLATEVKRICGESDLGFYLKADDEQKKYVFSMFTGENRTEEANTETEIETVGIQNLLTNGEFTAGLSGWTANGYGLTTVSGGSIGQMLKKTKLWDWWDEDDHSQGQRPLYSGYIQQHINVDSEHLYFIQVKTNNPTDSVVGFGILDSSACTFMCTGESVQKKFSTLYVPLSSGTKTFAMGYGDLSDEKQKKGAYLLSDYGFVLDLTATFGVGKEPTIDWCIENIFYDGGWKYKRQVISFIPNANDPLVFSRDRDTLIEVEYTKDITNECTHVYIDGNDDVKTVIQIGAAEGLKRKEGYLNLSSIPRESGGAVIPLPSYLAMLHYSAQATIRKMIVSELVTGKLYLLSNRKYGRDFHLGDIVAVTDNKIGFTSNLRITSATQVWDTTGYSISVNFGEEVPNIYETIALVAKGAK